MSLCSVLLAWGCWRKLSSNCFTLIFTDIPLSNRRAVLLLKVDTTWRNSTTRGAIFQFLKVNEGAYAGASLDLFEWGGGEYISEFCRVIKASFAESLQALINISFSKIVGKRGTGRGVGTTRSERFFAELRPVYRPNLRLFELLHMPQQILSFLILWFLSLDTFSW